MSAYFFLTRFRLRVEDKALDHDDRKRAEQPSTLTRDFLSWRLEAWGYCSALSRHVCGAGPSHSREEKFEQDNHAALHDGKGMFLRAAKISSYHPTGSFWRTAQIAFCKNPLM